MFRYVYSALLLVVTKPICDHIIRMIAKNTETTVDESTALLTAQLQKLKAQLANMSHDETIAELNKLSNTIDKQLSNEMSELRKDVTELRKLVISMRLYEESSNRNATKKSPVKNREDLQKIYKDVIEVRKLVTEKNAEMQKLMTTCQDEIIKNRDLAHKDAISLHEEHVQMYNTKRLTR